MTNRVSDFATLMLAFDSGYRRRGREGDWPCGLYRWAYVMGRRQSGCRARAMVEAEGDA